VAWGRPSSREIKGRSKLTDLPSAVERAVLQQLGRFSSWFEANRSRMAK
jgi:hypothetical protein